MAGGVKHGSPAEEPPSAPPPPDGVRKLGCPAPSCFQMNLKHFVLSWGRRVLKRTESTRNWV